MRSRLKRHTRNVHLKKIKSVALYGVYLIITSLIIFVGINYVYSNNQKLTSLQDKVDLLEQKASASEVKQCNERDSIHEVRNSVVRIIGGEAEGSGFAVDGKILTNFHVIEFDQSPKVVLPDNSFATGEIVYANKDIDLAVLQIDKNIPSLKFGDENNLEQTDELYALGFPFGGELQGELTVKKGILSGKRFSKDVGIVYIQTDSTLNPGLSGGPMVNKCGEVVGINTLGGTGMGLAISSTSIQQTWKTMIEESIDPLKDVKVLDIQENIDPLHTVEAYYSYIKLRKLEKAFALLGDYKKDFKFENWKKGYMTNLDTSIVTILNDESDQNKILVKLTTKDMVDGEIVYKYFEGYWIVKQVDDKWLLWDPNVKEVKDPEWSWFY